MDLIIENSFEHELLHLITLIIPVPHYLEHLRYFSSFIASSSTSINIRTHCIQSVIDNEVDWWIDVNN